MVRSVPANENHIPSAVARRSVASAWKSYAIAATLGVLLSWAYLSGVKAPPPRICGQPNGPPVTAPRIVLSDGRKLAYSERGVPKEQAKHKLIVVHGLEGSRHQSLSLVSQELLEELSVYMVSYDRAGYGQSDPNPTRTVKSEAFDVEELADQLELGPKFYLASISIGGYTAWSCLYYIPHRLAGVLMFSPVTNFWWSKLPSREAYNAFHTQAIGDKLALLVAHYTPSFLYFWMTQKLLPTSSTMGALHLHCNPMDRDTILGGKPDPAIAEEAMQQGIFESKIRDKMVMFGNWEFDPSEVPDPFPSKNGSVHIWQGDEDCLVPVALQRAVHRSLPWIQYHELAGVGHLLHAAPGVTEKAFRQLFQSS
ncbi:hypothetical protein SELMODRAFT_181321 [Selaginella moellendorffii]|uniref:AB hydrolase-1 domain-containing protein n=1 Tax=Selaginella moellendorffii TaxID=88036 RepID=D8SNK6_SELML|nr:uncharacterized protein LOC9648546 [Selaginella moellendorffii]EFJ14083.1 hypothetical protein SELMODRAFT_181321 [Selaginella moellendorffii]|eukprot:XP_002984833.1 uncharacterized protein LOC9648546 [Selaginella moellendorffii]